MTTPAIAPMRKLGLVLVGATAAVEAPLPGVYPAIPMVTYHQWPGASNSRLTKIRQSPAHLKAYMDEPAPDVAHFATGRAVHSAILEPEDFASKYAIAPNGDKRTKAVKEQWEELESRYGQGFVFKSDEYDAIIAMRDSVYSHPQARKLLTGKGECELSLTWTDADTGTLCKARLDRYTPALAGGVIVDVKTCRNASATAFERSVYDYGYHRQSAHYMTGAALTGLQAQHFVNIAVEKERPYAVAVYRMTEGAIDAGAAQLKPLIARYAECVAKDEWPGYSTDIQDVALPTYAWSQIDNEIRDGAA